MKVTARQLNRATLERQMLLRRVYREVPDAVHELCALQVQEPASPYIALWNRISGFDPADLDRAFTDRSVVKATLMRMTLHASTIRTTRTSTPRCIAASARAGSATTASP